MECVAEVHSAEATVVEAEAHSAEATVVAAEAVSEVDTVAEVAVEVAATVMEDVVNTLTSAFIIR